MPWWVIQAAKMFLSWDHYRFGHSKADREVSHGLTVDYFQFLDTTQFFYQNNEFPAFFFAASSTAF